MFPRALLKVALRGPGKGLMLVSAAGWIVMAWLVTSHSILNSVVSAGHGGHSVSALSSSMRDLSGHFTSVWVAMILAMAPPLLLREIGRLWRTSLRRLRHLTIGWFACGYIAVWLAAGVVFSSVVRGAAVSSVRIGLVVVLIAIWQCSPVRQRCLNACHRAPRLRVFGTRAQYDSLRYGISIGGYCAASCGPVMLLVLLATEHHLAVMAMALVVTAFERYLPARRPAWQLPMVRRRSIQWPDYGEGDARRVRCVP